MSATLMIEPSISTLSMKGNEMMNEGWRTVTLGELIADPRGGVSVNCEDRPITNGEVGVLKTSAVTGGSFDPREHKTALEEEAGKVATSVTKGSIIICRKNTPALVGSIAYVERDYPNLFLPDLLWRIDALPGVDARWLSYVLASVPVQASISDLATGSSASMKNISMPALKSIQVLLPPLPEQRRIAEILGAWDRALERLAGLIAAKEQRKRGLMKKLLSDLPGYEKWPVVLMSEVGAVVSGGTPNTAVPEYWDGAINWCTPTDISAKGKFIGSTARKITESGMKNSAAQVLPTGSIVVCTRASVGLCAITTEPMATNQGFKNLIPNDRADLNYLYYRILVLKPELIRLASGSTFLEVSKASFESIEIPLPPKEIQEQIGALLSLCDLEIDTLKDELEAVKRQKKGLMQQLLTGKVRVRVEESEIAG